MERDGTINRKGDKREKEIFSAITETEIKRDFSVHVRSVHLR